jgi:hypothetical protein
MSHPKANHKKPIPSLGMTSITGHKLDSLKATYHDLVSRVVSAGDSATLLFSHFGDFDTTKVENTLKLIESGILESGDKRSTMKRVCGMLIELLQNISIHGARDSKGHMNAYLIVAKVGVNYLLYSGNLILSEMVQPIQARMNDLVEMDSTSLRKLYIEILCNEEYSMQGGAGLGLVTIVKRAENNVRFNIDTIDEHFGFFQLEVTVPVSHSS